MMGCEAERYVRQAHLLGVSVEYLPSTTNYM